MRVSLALAAYAASVASVASVEARVTVRLAIPVDANGVADERSSKVRPESVTCTNLPAGVCCNNIFHFRFGFFYGLQPGDVPSTWRREPSVRMAYEAQVWRPNPDDTRSRQDDPDFSPLNGVRPGIYGCGGQNRDVGHGNPDGYWSTGPYTITGAMWLDCGQHPLDTIRRAFRFDPRETLTTIVLSIFRVYGISRTGNGMGQCNVPRRRRARGVEPRAGDEVTTQVEQLPDDMVINAAEDEKMGGQNGTGTGVGRQLLDSQRPRYEWRFPDIIEVGGVSYSDKGRGDLLYVNAAGEQLKLFGHVEHHRRKKEPSLEPEQEPEKKKPDHAEDGF